MVTSAGPIADRKPAEPSQGRVPKWTKGTDCKSVIRGFESHHGLFFPPSPASPAPANPATAAVITLRAAPGIQFPLDR